MNKKSMRDPDFLNAIIENVGALVIVLDHAGRIYRFNAACEKLSGFTFAEVEGKFPWDIFLPAEDADTVRAAAFVAHVNNPQTALNQYTNRWRAKSGDYRLIEWSNTLLRDSQDKVEFMISVGTDITERKQIEEDLRHSEERMRLVLNATNDGIWDWNPITHEDYLSPRWKEIVGYQEDELPSIDSVFFELIHPDDKASVVQAITNHFEKHAPYRVEMRLRHKNGSYRWVLSRGEAVRDADGKAVRMVGSITDITDLKQAEENLKVLNEQLETRVKQRTAEMTAARDEAERANRAKSAFLSRMSHELRTPMNAILGFSQLLEYESLPPHQLAYVQEIHRAGDYLLELINELLDLARIESGKMVVVSQPVNLAAALNTATEITQPLMNAKQIHLINQCSTDESVLADPTRLRQILVNLLSNAAKYNLSDGHINISCHDQNNGFLRLCVTDTGLGIPPEKQAYLFKPFERLGAEFTAVEGTGIGLALSKQLTELMGGQVGFNSTLGEGSTFWIELPLTAEAANTEKPIQQDKAINTGKPQQTVLYIEDNAANLRLVEAMLRQQSHLKLISATHGEFGLELARRYKPQVILLDIHLPGMDGYQVLEALKTDPITRDIPVIALSADAMSIDIDRGLQAGFIQYLTKPVKMDVLHETIARYL
ncbi:MAG: PAS domain S-box protein [Pseudomonadota bacterium]